MERLHLFFRRKFDTYYVVNEVIGLAVLRLVKYAIDHGTDEVQALQCGLDAAHEENLHALATPVSKITGVELDMQLMPSDIVSKLVLHHTESDPFLRLNIARAPGGRMSVGDRLEADRAYRSWMGDVPE